MDIFQALIAIGFVLVLLEAVFGVPNVKNLKD